MKKDDSMNQKEINKYINEVLSLAPTFKTNNSNFIQWHYEEMKDKYIKGVSVKDMAKFLADETQKEEDNGYLFGNQEYISYSESKKAAIASVNRLNKRSNNKWKTISMTKDGSWIADDCESENMKLTEEWWSNPSGLDFALNIKCKSQQNGLFKQSLTKIL